MFTVRTIPFFGLSVVLVEILEQNLQVVYLGLGPAPGLLTLLMLLSARHKLLQTSPMLLEVIQVSWLPLVKLIASV